ncbi:UDP-glycosyltransferase 78D3 [Camellia lanceoleosa]|uniref:UDP-glycosyltransferase 78D3 n=1 Tax=Camellia lanceoleosa TaxID=1840588 RepID=A0ACC0I0F5_9ERIC|nr:UDP-glycosyltransferase 78D3 [Camellia lanceoleosa]
MSTMMTNSSLPERHIAVLAFPFASHAGLTLWLICRLATAAVDVTFSFYSTAKSIQYLLSSSPIPDNIKPCPVLDEYVFSENMEDIELFLKVGKECFKRAMKAAED